MNTLTQEHMHININLHMLNILTSSNGNKKYATAGVTTGYKKKMSKKAKIAENLFLQGYNCSQAVFAAFSEETELDQKTALKLASSFGAGMGRLREVCGAVSAMFMIAGLKYGYSEPLDDVKAEHYRLVQELAYKFKEQNGSIVCRELLGLDEPEGSPAPERRTENYYKNRPCLELVKRAAEMMEQFLKEKEASGLP